MDTSDAGSITATDVKGSDMGNETAFFAARRTSSPILRTSLDIVAAIHANGLRFVPETPSPEMIDAAILAGAPSREDAERIYRAMIAAEG